MVFLHFIEGLIEGFHIFGHSVLFDNFSSFIVFFETRNKRTELHPRVAIANKFPKEIGHIFLEQVQGSQNREEGADLTLE